VPFQFLRIGSSGQLTINFRGDAVGGQAWRGFAVDGAVDAHVPWDAVEDDLCVAAYFMFVLGVLRGETHVIIVKELFIGLHQIEEQRSGACRRGEEERRPFSGVLEFIIDVILDLPHF